MDRNKTCIKQAYNNWYYLLAYNAYITMFSCVTMTPYNQYFSQWMPLWNV